MSGYASRAARLGGGMAVLLVIAFPLWAEFHEPGQMGWNIFLAATLILVTGLAVYAHRYFQLHADEIGEARFDTTNKSDLNG